MRRRRGAAAAGLGLLALAGGCDFFVMGPGMTGPCPDGPFFTVPFMPMEDIAYIIPLGDTGPPGHTLPVAHMYWNVLDPGGAPIDVLAPGDVVVSSVESVRYSNAPEQDDYVILLEACHNAVVTLGHVTSLSPDLEAELDGGGDCQSYTTTDGTVSRCAVETNLFRESGDVLGWAGEHAHTRGLDVGIRDDRLHHTILSSRLSGTERVGCALDYYEPDVRAALEGKLGDGVYSRTASPLCGQFAFDVPGTAQGNWFKVGGSGHVDDYSLALVRDDVLPDRLVFSISFVGSARDGSELHFFGATSGSVRRVFDQVVADGTVYCYDALHRWRSMTPGDAVGGAIVLVQLQSDGRLRFEIGSAASCGAGPWTFSGASLLFER